MSKKPRTAALNFALIGCGRISQTHLEAITKVPECKLVSVADTREQAAKSVPEQFGCKDFTDYREVLNGNSIDAAIICTPPDTHADIVIFFLDHDVNVLCEKPLALTTEQANVMVAKAEEKGSLLMMASKFRYVDDIVKAKGVVESGILGDFVLFENVFCSKVDMRNRWNSKREVAGGGVLVDNGCHSGPKRSGDRGKRCRFGNRVCCCTWWKSARPPNSTRPESVGSGAKPRASG